MAEREIREPPILEKSKQENFLGPRDLTSIPVCVHIDAHVYVYVCRCAHMLVHRYAYNDENADGGDRHTHVYTSV